MIADTKLSKFEVALNDLLQALFMSGFKSPGIVEIVFDKDQKEFIDQLRLYMDENDKELYYSDFGVVRFKYQ